MTFFVCWKSLASQNPQKNVFRLVTSVRQRNYIESLQWLNQTSDLRIPRCDALLLSHRDCRFLCPMLMTRRKTNFSISLPRSKFYHLSNSIYKQDAINIADPSSACWMRELRNGLARYRMSGKGCHNSCKTNRTVCSILRSRKASAVSTENPNYDRWKSHIHLHWTFNHLICKVIGCLLN